MFVRPFEDSSYLRAGENDWFAQMFTHEGQGRGCVSHSVCTMKDHKSIIVLIVVLETDRQKKMHIMWISLDGNNKNFYFFLPYYLLYIMSNMIITGLRDA